MGNVITFPTPSQDSAIAELRRQIEQIRETLNAIEANLHDLEEDNNE